MARVSNLWMGYALTVRERELLTALTLREFKKPVHLRCSPQDLMNRVISDYRKRINLKLEKLQNYERNTRHKRKGEQ